MPANLVPHAAIPDLAASVTQEMLEVLRRIQKAGYIVNDAGIDPDAARILEQLANKGLVDPAYEVSDKVSPHMWVSNGNGSRVLTYRTGIRGGPHYEIPSPELAAWLEEQGRDRCWNVAGDPLLTGRMTFPCPAANLAGELRKINLPLLVQGKMEDTDANGKVIGKDQLDELAGRMADLIHRTEPAPPDGSGDRCFYLCWKKRLWEWLLSEDSRTTRQRAQERARGDEAALVMKE